MESMRKRRNGYALMCAASAYRPVMLCAFLSAFALHIAKINSFFQQFFLLCTSSRCLYRIGPLQSSC